MFEGYEEPSLEHQIWGLEEGVRIISNVAFLDLAHKDKALSDVYYAIRHKISSWAVPWNAADVLAVGQGYSIWLKGESDYYILHEHDRVVWVENCESQPGDYRSGKAILVLKSGIRLEVHVSQDRECVTSLVARDCDFANADAEERFWCSAIHQLDDYWRRHERDMKKSAESDCRPQSQADQGSAEEAQPLTNKVTDETSS